MNAIEIPKSIKVILSYSDEVAVDCADFDAYEALPAGLTYNGKKYGKKGWNSDTGRCYYGTDKMFATY